MAESSCSVFLHFSLCVCLLRPFTQKLRLFKAIQNPCLPATAHFPLKKIRKKLANLQQNRLNYKCAFVFPLPYKQQNIYACAKIIHTESLVNVFSPPGKNSRLLSENRELVLFNFCIFSFTFSNIFSLAHHFPSSVSALNCFS